MIPRNLRATLLAALLAGIAPGVAVSNVARGDEEDPENCCADVGPIVLDPLPENATARERTLRAYHDSAPENAANSFLSTRFITDMKDRLAALPDDAPLQDRFAIRFALCQWLQRTGELDAAIEHGRACLELIDGKPEYASWLPETLFRLAAAHFRVAERRNCIARHTSESCIFPLAGTAIHVEKAGADAARETLVRLLALEGHDLEVEARWLLNIAHMALGDWPDGVPEKHRIAAESFRSEREIGRFVDRARELGFAHHTHAGSVILDDFTGDGRLDVFTCAFDTGRSAQLLASDGEGGFLPIARAAGLEFQLGGIHAVQGDIDGDGLLDVFVARGGGFYANDAPPSSLLRQHASGRFVDVSIESGVDVASPTRAAAFADIDLDGDLDLFIGCESSRNGEQTLHPSRLFVNDGAARFAERAKLAGIENTERCVGAGFGDIDADGDPDLYLSNALAPNRLFVNRGDTTFSDEAETRGVSRPIGSGPFAFLDSDNDGDLDLFVSFDHHHRPIRAVARYWTLGAIEGETQALYENDGSGRFTDVTEVRGLRRVIVTTGIGVGDVDDDGWQDLYLATGAHDLAALFPNQLLLGGPRFQDATFSAGVGHLQKGNGVALADLDGDLDLDLFVQTGGFYQDDGFGDVMFENPGNANHKLEVDLVGKRDNRFGVGARVRARVVTPRGPRDLFTFVGVGGSRGANPLRAHLGLGDATAIEFVEVTWPAGKTTQRLTDVALDSRIRIEQE